jgi:hypothetical protein
MPRTKPPKPSSYWLPIESAPKDGSVFLALHLSGIPAFVSHIRRSKKYNNKQWRIIGSQCAVFSVEDLAYCPQEFTHWMPLPKLPKIPPRKYPQEHWFTNYKANAAFKKQCGN